MQVASLKLLPHTLEHVRALVDGSDAYERRFGLRVADGVRDFLVGAEVSAAFLELMHPEDGLIWRWELERKPA